MGVRRSIGVGALVALLGVLGPARHAEAACSAPSAVAAYADSNQALAEYRVDGNQRLAQSFTVPSTVSLHSVDVLIRNEVTELSAPTDALTVDVALDQGGLPGLPIASAMRVASNTSLAFVSFDLSSFAGAATLQAGHRYWITAASNAALNDGYAWAAPAAPDGYGGGQGAFSAGSTGPWTASPLVDQLFRVYGRGCGFDPGGGGASGAPILSALGISPVRFRAARSGPSAASARRARVGTRIVYTLDRAGTVRFTVSRGARGRLVRLGGRRRCVAPTRSNRKARRCTRRVAVGGFAGPGARGRNALRFTGRIGGRRLRAGRYRLTAVATAGGSSGRRLSLGFRIVR